MENAYLNDTPEARGFVPVRDAYPEEIVDQCFDIDEDGEIITFGIGVGPHRVVSDPEWASLVAEACGVVEPEEDDV